MELKDGKSARLNIQIFKHCLFSRPNSKHFQKNDVDSAPSAERGPTSKSDPIRAYGRQRRPTSNGTGFFNRNPGSVAANEHKHCSYAG